MASCGVCEYGSGQPLRFTSSLLGGPRIYGWLFSFLNFGNSRFSLLALQMERVLAKAYDGFSFDAFELAEASQGHPLSTLAYFLFHKSGLISNFNLHPIKLARFLRIIEAGYPSQNPYHNAVHAADVLQVCYC